METTARPMQPAARAMLLTAAIPAFCARPNGLGRLETGFTVLYRGGKPSKPDRYAPCPCGSGKKFKFCCHLIGK